MALQASRLAQTRASLRRALSGPSALAFMPAAVLSAFWLGGEVWLIVTALIVPLLFAALGLLGRPVEDVHVSPSIDAALTTALAKAAVTGRHTGCFVVELDDIDGLRLRYGSAALGLVLKRVADRLQSALRDGDRVVPMVQGRFAIALTPMRHLDLESAIQLSGRLQTRAEEPVSIDAQSIYLSCSVGFALDTQIKAVTAQGLLSAALRACDTARAHGPSSIRAYAADLPPSRADTQTISADILARALENGEIRPWFQPQISTDTGHVSGFEALARWHHPERGLVPPSDFLPVLEASGQMERLCEVITYHALAALRDWDTQGFQVPMVAVNFTGQELRNPRLIDKLHWDLDRFDLSPDRFCVEVLETVVASSPDDIVARNINGLAKLGCRIDLDDFGTGHASISSIRRFAVSRLKIDRSFVVRVDRDPEQQRMVAAILTMADRLNLAVLAEGVETVGEHAMLAQLGCADVQGFGIARPMPVDQTADWLRRHASRLSDPPKIQGKTG